MNHEIRKDTRVPKFENHKSNCCNLCGNFKFLRSYQSKMTYFVPKLVTQLTLLLLKFFFSEKN